MLLPFVLGSSPHLPVSVCGTGIYIKDAHTFLASVLLDNSLLKISLYLAVRVFPLPRVSSTPVSYMLFNYIYSAGIFCLLSIGYASRPRLRSRLTLGGRTFPRNPQTFDGGVSRSALATYAGILSSIQSTAPFGTASARIHCSSTNTSTSIPKLRCQV